MAAPVDRASAQNLPFLADRDRYGVQTDEGSLRYCIDQRDPDWPLARAAALAIADALLARPVEYLVTDPIRGLDLDELYPYLVRNCDAYFGFKLLPQAYPDWLIITRSVYAAPYQLAVTDPAWRSLADIPPTVAIGTSLGSPADYAFLQYLGTASAAARRPRVPLASDAAAIAALQSGTVGAALVFAPSLWALRNSDPALAALRLIPTAPLPTVTVGVGAALLANNQFLRTGIDQAIAALVADGTLQRLIAEQDFPATAGP